MSDVNIVFAGGTDRGTDDEGVPFFLDNQANWSRFAKWAKTQEDLPALQQLAKDGVCEDTAVLSVDIEDALAPEDGGVLAVLDSLRELVGDGDEKETATIQTD